MKKFLVFHVMLAGLLLSASHLACAGEGFSIGASATRAAVDINTDGLDIKGDATGYRVFGTYMFNKNLGIEAGFSTFGEPDDNGIPSDMEVESDSVDVFVVGKHYVSEDVSFFAKAGFVQSRTETEIGDDDATETNHSSTDLALGLGGQYDITERFGVRSEIEWIDGIEAGAEQMISLSAVVRFK